MHSKIWLVISIMLFSTHCFAVKKQCLPYLEKLRNVQLQQKVGHTAKRGRSLAVKEEKARDKWWQCSRGKLTESPRKKNKNEKIPEVSVSQYTVLKSNSKTIFTNQLEIKGKYQGQQQQDWLNFYQKPDKCKKTKTTQQFAFCIEDQSRQQNEFEKQWRKPN